MKRFANKGEITPPTMLRTTLLGAPIKRGRADPVDDANLLVADLDPPHQGPDDLPPRLPIRLLQPLRDALRELLQLPDHQPEFRLLDRFADLLPVLRIQPRQPLPRGRDPRLELRPVEHPVAVRIDQPRNHPFHIRRQLPRVLHLLIWPGLCAPETPLVLPPHPFRLGQEAADVLPDGGVQDIGADLPVPTEALSAEPVAVRAGAAVVGVRDP